jgi:hypothetical protein
MNSLETLVAQSSDPMVFCLRHTEKSPFGLDREGPCSACKAKFLFAHLI